MSSKTRSPHFHVIEYIYIIKNICPDYFPHQKMMITDRQSLIDPTQPSTRHTHTHTQLTLKLRSLLHRRASGGFLNIKIITIIPKSN